MNLPSLISKLQESTGVDRELWRDINDRLAPKDSWLSNSAAIKLAHSFDRPDLLIPVALSMMPEGCDWFFGMQLDGSQPNASVGFKGSGYHAAPESEFDEWAHTIATALMIAILKARDAKQQEG